MQYLNPLEPGVMFWAGRDPRLILAEVKSLGVRCGQLLIPGGVAMDLASAAAWRAALAAEDFTLVTLFAAYDGEDYADAPTIQRTVGWIPPATRAVRLHRTFELSDFAATLGISSIALHVGFVPADDQHPDFIAVREMTRLLCDYAANNGQTFALETGQESARTLLHFFHAVDRANLKINFDPANLIMYGTDDPINALSVLAPHIVSVHAKDGTWPAAKGGLGHEEPLGKGEVGIERFVARLKEIGFTGPLNVEREAHDHGQRLIDIRKGVELLSKLV